MPGDVQLWLLPDDADGVPPGIRYGFQELSGDSVSVGTEAYSFWSNPAQRLPTTLLYSVGQATAQAVVDWLGPTTYYDLWGVGGSSGSTILASDHAQRIIGTTQGAMGGIGGRWRSSPDASAFLREYDADRNQVLDAIEYDWLMTKPVQNFYLFTFSSALDLARWIVVPNGSAAAVTARGYYLSGFPHMTGMTNKTDGYWEQFSRFHPRVTLRLSLVASGSQRAAGQSYIKFRSDSSGDEVRFDFRPSTDAARFVGRVTLHDYPDYRLILGTDPDTNVQIESLSIVVKGSKLGFSTHDERRAWEYTANAYPVSWGVRQPRGFSGVVSGPETGAWSLRNRFLGLERGMPYRVRFDSVARRWPNNGESLRCRFRLQTLGGTNLFDYPWEHTPGQGAVTHEIAVIALDGPPPVLAFLVDNSGVFLVDNIEIEQS